MGAVYQSIITDVGCIQQSLFGSVLFSIKRLENSDVFFCQVSYYTTNDSERTTSVFSLVADSTESPFNSSVAISYPFSTST